MLETLTPYIPLIGIPIIVLGFMLKFNPMLVVTVAGLVTGLSVGMNSVNLLETFGEKFMNARQLATFILILPIIGLLERYGLQEAAKKWISQIKSATAGRILALYFAVREGTAALGLLNLGGQAQTVRPLLAPMAEAAAVNRYGEDLPQSIRDKIKAHAAACDNIAVFFGEDIFIAFGAVLLMQSFLEENGIVIEPLHIGLWAIPTAIAAFVIHQSRLFFFDRGIARDVARFRKTQPQVAQTNPTEEQGAHV